MDSVWDPLRRRDVPLTEEEEVRQWFIGVLNESLGVPMGLMGSEVPLTYGRSRKKYRADIVVYGRDASPLAVVECKKPSVSLGEEVLSQALRYDMVLGVRFIFITNGRQTRVARRTPGGEIVFMEAAPTYQEMLQL